MTNSRARALPARSAIRCVPPMSGVMPTTASTRPNCTPSPAHSRSHASDSSSAAVRHRPCATASVGSGRSSIAWAKRSRRAVSSSAPRAPSPSNTWTSTPARDDVALGAEDQRPRRRLLDLDDRGLEVVEHRGAEEVQRRRVEHQLADVVVLLVEGLRHGPDPTMIGSCCAPRCASCSGSTCRSCARPFGPWDQVELAVAVCEAGGLGALGTAVRAVPELEAQWRRLRELTDRPFAINHTIRPFDEDGVRGDPALRAARDLVPHRRHPRADRARPRGRLPVDPAGDRPRAGRARARAGRGRASSPRAARPAATAAGSARWCWCRRSSTSRATSRWWRRAASPTAAASPPRSRSAPRARSSARASSPRRR